MVWTSVVITLLELAISVDAARPPQSVGFTCQSGNGNVKRINIDVRAKRFQEAGSPPAKIKSIDEAKITLRHYNTVTDGFYLDYSLDRSTLILTSTTASGEKVLTARWQCQMGQPFNFALERKF